MKLVYRNTDRFVPAFEELLGGVFNETSYGKLDYYNDTSYEEDENGFNYKFNLAGFKKEEIKVTSEKNMLNIFAKNQNSEFNKSTSIPKDADPQSCEAKYENGMLYLNFLKNEESKPITINIK
tara:strand:+ start:89 stop:457 length:369 start_codon:yes stop_codon:yes gene_type:complete